ncbi:MAG: hypothetical protein JWM19_6045, partial [Actinomycetia bacterium]|nr:hypothetical protein [Actinomycetes bacterium]
GDATASAGSLSYTSPNLTWTGSLTPGATATVTFSATVNNPDTGNRVLATLITSATPGSNCPASGPAPACGTSVTVLVPALTIVMTPGASSATPGSTVGYTVTITDSGQTPYTPATAVISLAGVLSDAAYNGNAAATAGTVTYASPTLTWTGTLAVGATATITYSVTVSNPDTGNHSLVTAVTSAAAGSNCPAGGGGAQCTAIVAIIAGPLSITAPASAGLGAGPPGATIQANLGTVQVTDDRGFGAGWTASVSSTDFTTGGGTPVETIPAGDATYVITGLAAATGPATFQVISPVGLSGSPQAVVSATNVTGNTSATWNPLIQVAVPGGAVGGTYTATITHSAS